jgi:hypothetical protein
MKLSDMIEKGHKIVPRQDCSGKVGYILDEEKVHVVAACALYMVRIGEAQSNKIRIIRQTRPFNDLDASLSHGASGPFIEEGLQLLNASMPPDPTFWNAFAKRDMGNMVVALNDGAKMKVEDIISFLRRHDL